LSFLESKASRKVFFGEIQAADRIGDSFKNDFPTLRFPAIWDLQEPFDHPYSA